MDATRAMRPAPQTAKGEAVQLLIVEDDVRLSAALAQILEENGYRVDAVHDGKTGFRYASAGIYDAIVLDVMLPEMNGLDVVANLRRANIATPVLLLTARDSIPDKICGLDSGADDYMTKPFSPAELLAHLRALTRRHGDVVFETIERGDLTLDVDSGDLSSGDKSIHLSFKELSLAKILMSNAGQAISKEMLIAKVWGIESNADDNNVEAYISFLRKKIAHVGSHAKIETLRKIGYRFVASSLGE